MRQVEKTARNVEEAIELALIDLDATRDEIDFEVLEKDSKGLLGIFGQKDAKVRVWIKEAKPTDTDATIIAQQEAAPITKAAAVLAEAVTEKVSAYLKQVTDLMGLDATINVTKGSDHLKAELSGEGMALLIGKRGKTLDALQYLTNLAMGHDEEYTHVILDSEDYREKRKKALEKLAHRMADQAKKQRRDIMLNPMNAYERRIVHSALASDRKVSTRSEGQEPYRKIIIFLNR